MVKIRRHVPRAPSSPFGVPSRRLRPLQIYKAPTLVATVISDGPKG
jgi:hypothetical protein